MRITGRSNSFLFGYASCPPGGLSYLVLLLNQHTMAGEIIDHSREPIAFVLLNGHVAKVHSKYLSLGSIDLDCSELRSEMLILKWVVVNAMTHNWSKCRE